MERARACACVCVRARVQARETRGILLSSCFAHVAAAHSPAARLLSKISSLCPASLSSYS